MNEPRPAGAGPGLAAAYHHCLSIARTHYENFPVASRLLPAGVRRPVAVIYAFARTADDLADEGPGDEAARLTALAAYGEKLAAVGRGEPVADPVFTALADVMARYALPPGLFEDLLTAFRRDVTQRRYADFADLLSYCRCSADPVGRLLLHLYGEATPENLVLSDRICTALQLINFFQDLAQDLEENDRIYLPQEDMARFGVTEEQLRARCCDPALTALMDFQIRRARALMLEGAPLGQRLGGRRGLELRLIVQGGLRILERLEANGPRVFSRPRLGWRDWGLVGLRALFH